MFRKNDDHNQERLFSHFNQLDTRLQKRLLNTWAPVFYDNVFSKIDETPFAVLYCADNGRPNFPINILLALEFIKHWKDLTDEELLEQASFNYQVAYAIGLRDLGEEYIAPRTLYDFRERIYRHALLKGSDGDLIFDQFKKLTDHFFKLTGIKTDDQRTDSTFVTPNIQKAGRLSLAFDVLFHAVKICPQSILSDVLQAVIKPQFKTDLLYKTKSKGLEVRLENLLNLSGQLLAITKGMSDLVKRQPIILLERFLQEQGIYNEIDDKWTAKKTGSSFANSLQSAHDSDATYRKKGRVGSTGYISNITETCNKENKAQLITDYNLEKNTVSDVEMLKERMVDIKSRTGLENMYADGGYYAESLEQVAQENNVTMHYSAMGGTKSKNDKVSFDQFNIKDRKIIITCPKEHQPNRTKFNENDKTLSAHFDVEVCKKCPLLDQCPIKLQKKEAVIRVSQKRLVADETRVKLEDGGRQYATSYRAAIEGTNSALKRGQGMGKLQVRGIHKSRVVVGLKMIGRNFQQAMHCLTRQAKKAAKVLKGIGNKLDIPLSRGESALVAS